MKIIGHRGAAGLAVENTAEAIKKALATKADELEIDARLGAQSVPVLSHDPNPSADALPLSEALRIIGNRRPVIVEIKPEEQTAPICAVLKKTRGVDFAVASFSLPVLLAVQKDLPRTPLIVLDKWSGVRATHRARKLGTKRIGMNQRWLWGGFIRMMRKSGYQLAAYTVNNLKQAERFKRAGIYGIVTDFPDRFKN